MLPNFATSNVCWNLLHFAQMLPKFAGILPKFAEFWDEVGRENIERKDKCESKNIFFKHADGGLGWSEQAPFDRIIVTASAPEIPTKLLSQLVDNGIMVIPVGEDNDNQVLKK